MIQLTELSVDTTPEETSENDTPRRWASRVDLSGRLPQAGFILLFAALFIVFSVLKPSVFFTTGLITSVLSTSIIAMLLSVGLVFVLIARDFDLSIAAIAALAGSTSIYLMAHEHQSTAIAVLAGLAVGLICGVLNGFTVAYMKANALIATLATTSVFTGIQEWVTDSSTISQGINPSYIELTARKWFGVPAAVIVVVVICALTAFVLRSTVFGRHAYATGANEAASHLAGIRTASVRFWSFATLGLFAGMAGVAITSLGGSTPQGGSTSTYLLPAYASAFLGAITLGRGRFTAWSALFGVLFVNMLQAGLIVVQAPLFTTDLVTGLVLLVAVLISRAAAPRVAVN